MKLSKNRELTVGEHERFGRLIASAASKKNDTDPLAPIRYVVAEAGDYLTYEENFPGIRNPHQLIGNGTRERWVDEVFAGSRGMKRRRVPSDEMRETESFGQVNSRITTIEGAIAHIANGGSLGDLSPTVLAKLLSQPDYAKRLDGNIISIGPKKYSLENKEQSTQQFLKGLLRTCNSSWVLNHRTYFQSAGATEGAFFVSDQNQQSLVQA